MYPSGFVTLVTLILFYVSETRSQYRHYASEPKQVLMAAEETVYVFDLETPNLTEIATGQKGTTAVDYYLEKKTIVWTDALGSLYKLDMVTQNYSAFVTGDILGNFGVAVDWIQGNIYWTNLNANTINVVTFDGRLRKTLIRSDLYTPFAIVLNPLERWMFWAEWADTKKDSSKIQRSGMDGTHRSTVVSNNYGLPYGLAIDLDSRKIYWVEIGSICSSDYDGSNAKVMVNYDTVLTFPIGLDLLEDSVYWTEWNGLKKADKLTGKNKQTLVGRSSTGIRILHSSKQPKGENYCKKNAECTHLCLLSPAISQESRNFTCACPDGMTLSDDQKSCIVGTGFPPRSTAHTNSTTSSNTASTTRSTTISTTTTIIDIFTYVDTTTFKDAPTVMAVEDESRGTSKIAGILSVVLISLIIISVVFFCVYKHRLRRNITTDLEESLVSETI